MGGLGQSLKRRKCSASLHCCRSVGAQGPDIAQPFRMARSLNLQVVVDDFMGGTKSVCISGCSFLQCPSETEELDWSEGAVTQSCLCSGGIALVGGEREPHCVMLSVTPLTWEPLTVVIMFTVHLSSHLRPLH